ncbi:MAG: PQQ-dependent sugar dehydrogenase [Acidobacteriota bacterium]
MRVLFPLLAGLLLVSLSECLAANGSRVVLDGRKVVSQENLLEGKYGWVRDVATGPDGAIYFSTSNRDGRGSPAKDDDRIIRMAPVK